MNERRKLKQIFIFTLEALRLTCYDILISIILWFAKSEENIFFMRLSPKSVSYIWDSFSKANGRAWTLLTLVLMSMLRLMAWNAKRLLESLTVRWVGGSSQRRYARSQTHTVSTLVSFLSPLFPYKASPWGRLTAWFWIYPSCLDNKAQSIVLLLYLLSEYHENLRATLIGQQRGQGTSETREAGNGGKGGQEWAGQTEVSFPKISRPGAVLVWGLR